MSKIESFIISVIGLIIIAIGFSQFKLSREYNYTFYEYLIVKNIDLVQCSDKTYSLNDIYKIEKEYEGTKSLKSIFSNCDSYIKYLAFVENTLTILVILGLLSLVLVLGVLIYAHYKSNKNEEFDFTGYIFISIMFILLEITPYLNSFTSILAGILILLSPLIFRK